MSVQVESVPDRLRSLIDVLERDVAGGNVDLMTVVRTVGEIEEQAQRMLGPVIWMLRAFGRTWQDIGDELGITRQAAQQRFARHLKAYEEELASSPTRSSLRIR